MTVQYTLDGRPDLPPPDACAACRRHRDRREHVGRRAVGTHECDGHQRLHEREAIIEFGGG